MKKRVISVILAACCLLAAGCDSTTESSGASVTSEAVSSSESEAEVTTSAVSETESTAEPEVTTAASSTAEPLVTTAMTTTAEPEVTTTAATSVTTASPTATTTVTTQQEKPEEPAEAPFNRGTAKEITLSGDSKDTYYIEEDCYALSDRAVFYIQKGVTVRGDMLENAEKVMDDLCEVTGLDYSIKYCMEGVVEGWLPWYFDEGSFVDVNTEGEMVNIFIADFSDIYVQWAEHNLTALDPSDFNLDESGGYTAYHELSHVIYLNNGVQLGSTMDEGAAELTAEKALMMNGRQVWNWVQHYYPASFDESPVASGEDGFDYAFNYMDDRHYAYGYGFRFIKYLEDVYGEDIYVKILNEATARGFWAGYDPSNEEESYKQNTEQLKSIIKSQTSEDVFDNFSSWYTSSWSGEVQKWYDYMVSIGEEMF